MVHVSIQHIIGTVALIGLVVSLALAYQIIVVSVETSVLKTQLNQVAEYVSMCISNVMSLTDFTYGIFKEYVTVSMNLDLPADLGGKVYVIRFVNETGGLYVLVEVPGRRDLYAKSSISVNPTSNIQVVVDENFAPSDPTVEPKSHIYGGNPNAIVWCEVRGDVLYIGLGLRRPSG
ncbi:MAG: hypothetical protein QXT26_02905 [Thermoproteota archaeon]